MTVLKLLNSEAEHATLTSNKNDRLIAEAMLLLGLGSLTLSVNATKDFYHSPSIEFNRIAAKESEMANVTLLSKPKIKAANCSISFTRSKPIFEDGLTSIY